MPFVKVDDATVQQVQGGVKADRLAFLEQFTTKFFAAGDRTDLVPEPERQFARHLAAFASPKGTLDCIAAFSYTDFRADLEKVRVPTLVIHGDADAIVPFEVSGRRTHQAVADSELVGHGRRPARAQRHPRRRVQPRAAGLPGALGPRSAGSEASVAPQPSWASSRVRPAGARMAVTSIRSRYPAAVSRIADARKGAQTAREAGRAGPVWNQARTRQASPSRIAAIPCLT